MVQLGHLDKRQGRLADALDHYRKAYQLDRRNPETRGSLEYWLMATRRYDEAAELEHKDPQDDGVTLALLAFYARGSTREMEDWIATHPAFSSDAIMAWKFKTGDAAGFVRLADEARRSQPAGFLNGYREAQYGCALMALGEVDRAKVVLTKIVERLRAGPRTGFAGLPVILGFLGEKQAALAAFDEFIAERDKQAVNRDFVVDNQAKLVILAWVGEKDQSLVELARILKVPAGVNVHELRHSPHFLPLQGDPRFEAILNDPKNNAPLL
jgi:tetratricopeptide (TPR) repeat protein